MPTPNFIIHNVGILLYLKQKNLNLVSTFLLLTLLKELSFP